MKKSTKWLLIILCVFLSIIIAFGGTFAFIYYYGKSLIGENNADIILPDDIVAEVYDNGDTLVYKGHRYKYNSQMISALIMGIDRDSLDYDNGVGYNGQADADILCALNPETNEISLIAINRDTIVGVNTYSQTGEFVETKDMQLCLAYAYGNGKETSCTNVATSVSRLFCNMPVQLYASIDEHAVAELNDMLGGVTVPEYTSDGSTKTGNKITLHGEEAFNYVKERNTKYFDSNIGRVNRQKDYITAFAKQAITATKSNLRLPIALYNSISDYMVTNIDISRISYIVTNYIDKPLTSKSYTLDGKLTEIDGRAAFIPDTDKLFQLILDVFYTKIS